MQRMKSFHLSTSMDEMLRSCSSTRVLPKSFSEYDLRQLSVAKQNRQHASHGVNYKMDHSLLLNPKVIKQQ